MTDSGLQENSYVNAGLERLRDQAFGESGFAHGVDELYYVLIHRGSNTIGFRYAVVNGQTRTRGMTEPDAEFTYEAYDEWLVSALVEK
ncbi:hypothetical protein [Paenarthrobacter sp. NPDC018779]|uniref:hypothetical protein n=1 Tax=Paenarthrobacter sp. NPDC018779 TaxID=3364375 RepID=UPI0037C70870